MVTLSFTVDSKVAKQLVEAYENITSEKCTEVVEPIEIKAKAVEPVKEVPNEAVAEAPVEPLEEVNSEPVESEVEHIDLECVRRVMAERSMNGEKDAMKGMLSALGLKKISEANLDQLDTLWSQLQQ